MALFAPVLLKNQLPTLYPLSLATTTVILMIVQILPSQISVFSQVAAEREAGTRQGRGVKSVIKPVKELMNS